jgi:hypothetical protein
MSRYIVIPAPSKQSATHEKDGAYFRIIDTEGRQVESSAPRVESINGYEALPPRAPTRRPVPLSVDSASFRIAILRRHGITDGQVYAAINASELTDLEKNEARIEFEYRKNIRRDHPLVNTFASAAFNLTQEEVDEVFRLAATL